MYMRGLVVDLSDRSTPCLLILIGVSHCIGIAMSWALLVVDQPNRSMPSHAMSSDMDKVSVIA